jgi:hypothetical protein
MPTASQARSLLSEYSLDEVRQLYPGEDDTTIMALYLGNLCARGDFKKVEMFIQEHESYPQHLHAILNCAPYDQWHGNCLHMVMFWNTGDNAMSLFTLLASHGAEYIRNYYEVFPCQIHAPVYIAPINGVDLGGRFIAEFQDTYQTLILQYGLDDSKNPLTDVEEDDEDEDDDYEDDYDPDPYAHCMHPDGCPSRCICACYNCNP